MTVQLDLTAERFVAEQIAAGRFESAEAVVSAAMSLLISGPVGEFNDGLDAEDAAVLADADREYAAGLCRPWREVSADLRRKYPEE